MKPNVITLDDSDSYSSEDDIPLTMLKQAGGKIAKENREEKVFIRIVLH